jgi:hypothetical protein
LRKEVIASGVVLTRWRSPARASGEALAFVIGVEESGLAVLLYHAKVSREHINGLLGVLGEPKKPLDFVQLKQIHPRQ